MITFSLENLKDLVAYNNCTLHFLISASLDCSYFLLFQSVIRALVTRTMANGQKLVQASPALHGKTTVKGKSWPYMSRLQNKLKAEMYI